MYCVEPQHGPPVTWLQFVVTRANHPSLNSEDFLFFCCFFYFPFYFVNKTTACALFCLLLALPSRAVRQEGPYNPTSETSEKKGLEGKTTTLHVYHTFLYIS